MCFFGGGDDAAEQARREEAERQARIAEGRAAINQTFGQTFTPEFYSGIEQSALDYWNPQVERQYDDAVKRLTLALSGANLLNSSVRGQQFADLQSDYDLARQNIAARASDIVNRRRQAVNQAQSNVYSQLLSSADPAQATSLASANALALGETPLFEPLEQFFADAAGDIVAARDVQRRRQARDQLSDYGVSTGSGSSAYIT